MFGQHNDKIQDVSASSAPSQDASSTAPTPPGFDAAVSATTPPAPADVPTSNDAGDYMLSNSDPSHTSSATPPVTGDTDLLQIKQGALQQLSPLVGHLDQTPEEKFRTTMMMIQASDDQSLLKTAYEAAQNISDEKVKAQALLDIVNEINYFTQQNS